MLKRKVGGQNKVYVIYWVSNVLFRYHSWRIELKIARHTTGAKGRKSNKAIIRFQKFDRSLNEIRYQC